MANDDHALWYVAEGSERHGPYSPNLLQRHFDDGMFSESALVWHAGMSTWRPIVLHFKKSNTESPLEVAIPIFVSGTQPETSDKAEGEKQQWFWLLLTAAAALTGTAAIWYDVPQLENFEPDVAFYLRCTLIGVTLIAAMVGAFLWWNASASKWLGLARVFTIFGVIVVAASAFIAAVQTPLWYRLQVARSSFNRYSLNTDILAKSIAIRGLIGPGLAQKLKIQLDANSGIRNIVIDSDGGLVDVAMDAARIIQAHGRLTTVVEKVCNSACIIMFMAGESRSSAWNIKFGFHAISPITAIKGAYNLEAMQHLTDGANKYLMERGVPESYLKGAAALGPDKVYPVSAVELADHNVVSQLTSEHGPISVDEGKWLAIMDGLNRDAEVAPLATIFAEIKSFDPATAQATASLLWQKLIQHDFAGLVEPIRKLIEKYVSQALPAADNSTVADLVSVTSQELEFIRQKQRWDVCAAFVDGKGFNNLAPPPLLVQREFQASANLISSAVQRNWAKQAVPVWAESEGAGLIKDLALEMLANGEDIRSMDQNPKIKCDWGANLFSKIATKPANEAAGLYAWVVSQK
jgi:hypothetical protein